MHERRAAAALRAAGMLLLASLLGACGLLAHQAPGSAEVRHAQLLVGEAGAQLALALDVELSGPMQDALDHGIPLTLRVDLRSSTLRAQPRVELRYFPLSRRYQLIEGGRDDERGYATRGYLLAALGSLRLPLPAAFARLGPDAPFTVAVALDPAALPGALRLPALFEPAWRLASLESTWPRATP